MKKRSLGVMILTLVMLFIPNNVVKADTPFDFKCNDKATNGEIIKCELKYVGSSTGAIKSIKGSITQNSNFTIERFEANPIFDNQSSNKDNLTFEYSTSPDNNGVPVSENIITVYLKATMSDTTKSADQVILKVSTVDGTITSGSNMNVPSNTIKLERKDENRLSSLSVSNGTLSPSFNSDTLEYTLTTDEEEITLTPVTKDALATFEVNGNNNGKVALEYGENKVEIKVAAQDGTVRTYKITVIRKDTRNDNAKLQLLSVDGKKVPLRDNNYNYTVDVSYDTEDANLLYATSSSTSIVEVTGNEKLTVGENNIIIIVTSEKGTIQKYYLTINRLKEIKSDDSSIKKLEILNVSGLDFKFKSINHNYIIKLPKNITELKFNIELNDPKASYKISGNEDLENYSKVLIKVTAEDESTTTYSFLIEKDEKTSNPMLIVILVILVLILIGIIVGIIIVVKKNKNNKNDKNDKNDKNNKDNSNADNDDKKSKLVDNITMNEAPKKDENNFIVFGDPDEEKKEETVVIEDPKEEAIDEEKEDTKEFVISRPAATIDNPEFEENTVRLENPVFDEKDTNTEENPNFE